MSCGETGYGDGGYGAGLYGGGVNGVPLLPSKLVDGWVALKAAWGADLTADEDDWLWYDITCDVRMDSGISMRFGANSESGLCQPAQLTVTLDNTNGDYSAGGKASNWPYIRQGTPIRLEVSAGNEEFGGWRIFQGNADEWAPDWDDSGADATVTLTASGTLRRLGANEAPVQSPMYRRIVADPTTVGYWPMEDGETAILAASAIEGHPPMTVYRGDGAAPDVQWAESTAFACSKPLPVLGLLTAFIARVPTYTPSTTQADIRWLMSWPDSAQTDESVIARIIFNSATLYWVDLIYAQVSGALRAQAYNRNMTSVYNSGDIGFSVNGSNCRMFIDFNQVGGNVEIEFGVLDVGSVSPETWSATINSVTLGTVDKVEFNPNGDLDGVGIGHLSVHDDDTNILDEYNQLNAFAAEVVTTASGRIQRLCDENDIPLTLAGGVETPGYDTDLCGPQQTEALVPLLRQAEGVDRGLLLDGTTQGLSYFTRRILENRAADLTIDAADLAPGWSVTNDDFIRLNRAEVTKVGGSSATYTDTDGPVGTEVVGVYDGQFDINCQRTAALPLYAGWFVNLGTVDGYRIPQLVLNLGALTPEQVDAFIQTVPGMRLDITGLSDVRPQLPDGTFSFQVRGVAHEITPYTWITTLNLAPYDPLRVLVLAEPTGDTDEFLGHLDTEGSELAAAASKNAPTLSVATTSGPLWTTVADDCPFQVEVAGIPVTVTAVSGASSPQTFTVTSSTVTKALPSGSQVKVYRPTVLGL